MCGGGRGQHCGTILSQRKFLQKFGIGLFQMFLNFDEIHCAVIT